MKKTFTLISAALLAVSVNAQTESYEAINSSGVFAKEFANILGDNNVATNASNGQSIVKFGTTNVTAVAVGGTTPADVQDKEGNTKETHVAIDAKGNVSKWNDVKWGSGNRGDINYYWIAGTGVPYVNLGVEQVFKDDEAVTYIDDNGKTQNKYRAVYSYYTPDGANGLPKSGLYYKFTTAKAGVMKIHVWVNKGNRNLFVVDEATKKPVKCSYSGYINGQNGADGKMKLLSAADIANLSSADKPYVVGAGNQAFFGSASFEVAAGKTYWVFGDNWQVGFNGYEFTSSTAGINDITVETSADGAIYNLAGQKVGKDYKGVVIKNGKKYIQK